MRLVSWDVGLRNLSYCVLEGTNRHDVKILHWEVIDVLAEQSGLDNPRCSRCERAASFQHSAEGTLVCSRHKPKQAHPVTKAYYTKQGIGELQEEADRLGLQHDRMRKPQLVTLLYNQAKANNWKRCVRSVFAGSVADLAPAIKKSLDSRLSAWADADRVCFENQPDRRMFAVQCMLHMYFTHSGFRCQGVSATHKLTNIVTIDDRVDSYKGRKKTGIVHAEALVPEVWKAHLLKHPKKDDLADAFLQGLWLLEHHK